MIRIAANLSTLFTELPMKARFEAAARAGFSAVELQFPYDWPAAVIAEALNANGLRLALINAPAGDLAKGDRGLAFADRESFTASIDLAIDYACRTECGHIHLLVGNRPPDATAVGNLREGARRLARHGLTMLIEPLNPRDQPGYALPDLATAEALRIALGEDNVKLQLDAYHLLRSGADPRAAFFDHADRVGHVQVADPGDRGEPADPALLSFLDAMAAFDWNGFVGAEYHPRGETMAGLGWARPYGILPGGAAHG